MGYTKETRVKLSIKPSEQQSDALEPHQTVKTPLSLNLLDHLDSDHHGVVMSTKLQDKLKKRRDHPSENE